MIYNAQNNIPVIIGRAYGDLSASDLQLYSSIDIGALFIDGLGDGLYIAAEKLWFIKTNKWYFFWNLTSKSYTDY